MFFRRILEEARNKQRRAIFETFSSEEASEFLVVSRARWDEHQKKMSVQNEELRRTPITLQQTSVTSMDEQGDGWSLVEKSAIAAMKGYLEESINIKVGTRTWSS